MVSSKGIRARLEALFAAAITAADPYRLITRVTKVEGERLLVQESDNTCPLIFPLTGRIFVIGAGKGAGLLARGLETVLGDRLAGGVVVLPIGQILDLEHLVIINGEHPLPGQGSLRGAEEVCKLLIKAQALDLICCCLTGGASSLLVSPVRGVTLEEKLLVNQLLLSCGADIHEVNIVRKHLSRVKGGRLARWSFPATMVSFILSDVIGDDLGTIGSGPTAPDSSTFREAWEVLERYHLLDQVPSSALAYLSAGLNGFRSETPKPGDEVFTRISNVLVGSNRLALEAAAAAARNSGFAVQLVPAPLSGDTGKAAQRFAHILRSILLTIREPICVLAGGETTVLVTGRGRGGRNQEFALVVAQELASEEGWGLLSAGTDGIDGPTDAAGAFVDGRSVARAIQNGLNPSDFLSNNDTYTLFAALGDLFTPGPTGTNVMDVKVALLFPPSFAPLD